MLCGTSLLLFHRRHTSPYRAGDAAIALPPSLGMGTHPPAILMVTIFLDTRADAVTLSLGATSEISEFWLHEFCLK